VAGDRIESLRRLVEIWNRGDVDGLVDALPPEFEFTTDPSFPDAGTYRGDEVRPWLREWARSWQDNKLEFLQFTEYGRAVIAQARWHLAAPRSGDAVPVSDFSLVFWFDRDGDDRPTRMDAFFDRERALQEAQSGIG
jgi:ketosteroid isomerase-like protein